MNINDLNRYQSDTGLNFVMGGNINDQIRALEKFKAMVIEEYFEASQGCVKDLVKLPPGLPKPNSTVAVLTKLGTIDVCKFITTSDGCWYFDNMKNTVWQHDEVKEWKEVDEL